MLTVPCTVESIDGMTVGVVVNKDSCVEMPVVCDVAYVDVHVGGKEKGEALKGIESRKAVAEELSKEVVGTV